MIAGSLFVFGTLVEIIAIELWRGPLVEWLTQPQKLPLLLVMIGINAVQGSLFGYAAHRAARNKREWRLAQLEHHQRTRRLREELRPALSIVQYAAYKTSDKQCIEICNRAIKLVTQTVAGVEAET
jgi:hypothetical protein